MKLKSIGMTVIMALLAGSASVSLAADVKWTVEYDFVHEQNDDGLNEDDAVTTNYFRAKRVRVGGETAISDKVSVKFRVNPNDSGTDNADILDYINTTYAPMKNVSFEVGNSKAHTYGYSLIASGMDFANSSFRGDGEYHKNGQYIPNITANYSMGDHTVSLQVLNDCYTCSWHAGKPEGTATSLQYMGSIGPVAPLLQYLMYDYGHSSALAFGLKYTHDMVSAWFDYVSDGYSIKTPKASGGHEDSVSTLNGIALHVEATMSNVTVGVHYSSKDVVQDGTDATSNTVVASTTAPTHYQWDDNHNRIALSFGYTGIADAYNPYFTYQQDSGKFMKGTEEKDLSQSTITLGVRGKI